MTTYTYKEKNSYQRFSKFKTVEEFNNHFEQAMLLHKDKFTKKEYVALNRLRKFAYSKKSLTTIGVAWSRAQAVIDAIKNASTFGISRATFHRMLIKAKKLNLITVINQFKKNKYQKHNVYMFNKLDELTPEKFDESTPKNLPIETPIEPNFETPVTILLELPRFKDLNTYSTSETEPVDNIVDKEVDKEIKEPQTEKPKKEKPKTPYQKVCAKLSGLFKDRTTIYKIYGVWLAKIKKMTFSTLPFELCLQALHALIGEMKRRNSTEQRPLNNPVGYFSGILEKMINQWDVEQTRLAVIEMYENGYAQHEEHMTLYGSTV